MTEEEGDRNEGNEGAFSSDQAAIAVTEVEENILIEPKTVKDDYCQAIEFYYMFLTSRYQAPNKDSFETDAKVCFYTWLPSMQILMIVFKHVSYHVTRQTQSLNRFHDFIIVPMKLRLNAPLQDLVYQFVFSL